MLDKILATISLLALISFMGIVVVYVKELDLTIVIVVVLIMATYDFWITFHNKKTKNK